VNFETGEWLIPAENAKMASHIVYMSRQIAEMMQELKHLAGNSGWSCLAVEASRSRSRRTR